MGGNKFIQDGLPFANLAFHRPPHHHRRWEIHQTILNPAVPESRQMIEKGSLGFALNGHRFVPKARQPSRKLSFKALLA